MKKSAPTLLYRQDNKNMVLNSVGGFSLVEALVSIGIVTLIMSSVLFDYSTFNDNLALSSIGQEMSIAMRQAQTYGLTVREAGQTSGRFDSAYGVHFDKDDPTNYYLFADLDGDRKYDIGAGCGSGPTNTECVEKFSLRNGVTVSEICSVTDCPPPAARAMDITFLRPNPDAVVKFINNGGQAIGGTYLTGKVRLLSSKGGTLLITIESTGQVLVGEVD